MLKRKNKTVRGLWISPSGEHLRQVILMLPSNTFLYYTSEDGCGFGFSNDDIPELFDGWTYLGKL
jgi:hypothetical protein